MQSIVHNHILKVGISEDFKMKPSLKWVRSKTHERTEDKMHSSDPCRLQGLVANSPMNTLSFLRLEKCMGNRSAALVFQESLAHMCSTLNLQDWGLHSAATWISLHLSAAYFRVGVSFKWLQDRWGGTAGRSVSLQTQQPEFNPQDSYGGRRGPSPASVLWPPYLGTRAHTQAINTILKDQ